DALNHPDAVTDWSGGLGVSWGALDPAAWAGRHVARARSRAASLGADRREDAVVYETRVLYLEAVRADARLAAVEAGEVAAMATRDLLARREREGLVTRADVLRAEAALADAHARKVDAERMTADARARLALHLGMDPTTPLVPVDTVALAPAPAVPEAPAAALAERPDVRAAGALVEAARAEARQAGMARLPTVELFGAVSTHAPGAFDDREANATLGVQLRVPLFTGGALSARREAAEAMARAADLDQLDALARARAELDESRRALESAGEALVAATAAADAAEEASRLTRRRFQEGLATTADLLQAEAEATRLRTAAVDARTRVQIARAAVAFALGATTETPGGLDR
ncbi:MAG: TolC family protein, partial [Gemmatimonadota bacterium]